MRYENGKNILYVNILRSIHGLIESALLWYKLYSETFEGMEFVINPYNRCVTNKMINGKQCKILRCIEDKNWSYVNPNVVTYILELIKEHLVS